MLLSNKYSIFPFFILLPVFISFSREMNYTFDRVGGISSDFILTIPVSLILVTIFFFKERVFLRSMHNGSINNVLLFSLYCVFCIAINILANESISPSMLRVTFLFILFLLFLLFLKLFDTWLLKEIDPNKNHLELIKKYIFHPLIVVFLVTIFSDIMLNRQVFMFESIIIYNYEQYYSFLFVILSGVAMQLNMKILIKFAIFYASVIISIWSGNTTAFMLLFLLLVWKASSLVCSKSILYNFTLVLLILIIPTYFLYIYSYYELGMLSSNFESRVFIIREYIDRLDWQEFLLPFLQETRGATADYHNQFLEIFNSLGLIGLFYFFGTIWLKLKRIGSQFPDVGVALALVVFGGGLIVNTTMHPYLIICLSYIIAFFHRMSLISKV